MAEDGHGVRSALCYFPIFGFLYSFFLFLQKDVPRNVRFHAVQCLLIGTGFIVSMVTLMLVVIIATAFKGGSFLQMMGLIAFVIGYNSMMWAGFLLTFILMALAYTRGVFKVPVLGEAAEAFVEKM